MRTITENINNFKTVGDLKKWLDNISDDFCLEWWNYGDADVKNITLEIEIKPIPTLFLKVTAYNNN